MGAPQIAMQKVSEESAHAVMHSRKFRPATDKLGQSAHSPAHADQYGRSRAPIRQRFGYEPSTSGAQRGARRRVSRTIGGTGNA